MKNTNKGITLIALIITIIVMLILVAVTITMAVNGGLFEKAADAGKQTNDAVKAEQELGKGRIKVGNTWYDSPQDYVDNKPSKNQGDGENKEETPGGGTEQEPETPTEPETPVEPEITAADIAGAQDKTLYYGKEIKNYTLPSTNTEEITWRIFHSDGNNIYLIASDYVQKAPGIDGINYEKSFAEVYEGYSVSKENNTKLISDSNPAKKWLYNETTQEYEYLNSEYNNMKAVAYMLDTSEWNSLYKDTQGFAEYVIGGPTIKMYAESYNATHDNDIVYQKSTDSDDYGYMVRLGHEITMDYYLVGLQGDLYVIEDDEKAYGMWLASPSAGRDYSLLSVDCRAYLNACGLNYADRGFRPVVCLSSEVSLEQVGDGENITFKLK